MKQGIIILSMMCCLIASACNGSQTNNPDEGSATSKLTEADARTIAIGSGCVDKGDIGESEGYNENSNTWWFTLNMKSEEAKEGCSPACVVAESSKSAEINWRCTGLMR